MPKLLLLPFLELFELSRWKGTRKRKREREKKG